VLADVVLTVSESKRLIAKGVASMPCVREALRSGLVVISTGSTNAYVVEEILGKKINKPSYVTGKVVPWGMDPSKPLSSERMPDVILKDGQVIEGMDRFQAVREMGPGDVFIKGANALNYERRVAGVSIIGAQGGTIGGVLGALLWRKATLVIPVGLEKLVAHDIIESSRLIGQGEREIASMFPSLFPVTGEIVTEIEALEILTGVKAFHIGSGGIMGAEGAVRLLLKGDRGRVEEALKLVESIYGEPPFVPIPEREKAQGG